MSTLLHSSVPGNIRYSPTSSTALACSKRLPICLGAWRTLVCCAYHAGDHINGIDTRQGETSPVFRRGCTCSLSTTWTITQFGVRVCAVRVITPTMLNPPVPSRPPSKWRTVSVVPGVCTKHGRAPTVLRKHIAHIGLRIAADSLRWIKCLASSIRRVNGYVVMTLCESCTTSARNLGTVLLNKKSMSWR